MDQQKVLRLGAAVILVAIVFRLLGGGALGAIAQALEDPDLAAFLLYLETGRVVRPEDPTDPTETQPTEPPPTEPPPTQPAQPTQPTQPDEPDRPVFSPADALSVGLTDYAGLAPDVEALLLQALDWDLTGPEPTVLIVHTHTTESYTRSPGEEYVTSDGDYRTLDEGYNMVSVGQRVVELLESAGIGVIHVRQVHDYPSFSGAYNNCRATVRQYLARYPSIRLVLDLHRDAADDGAGGQYATRAEVDGQSSAQLMFMVGSDAGGLYHPGWENNLALAVKFTAQLERMYPGVTRRIGLTASRYNQDLLPGMLLVEVGAAGNTRAQALVAAEALARAVIALSRGTG